MRPQIAAVIASAAASVSAASNDTTPQAPNVVPSLWDGHCFYPTADSGFKLDSYLGRWYQVAGTIAPFTAGCKCIYAQYSLNDDGTVKVNNTCEAQGRAVNILGSASPAGPAYGVDGAFRVQFPGQPGEPCPGPNYIVQDYANDIAIVQSSNFSTLFILSRDQHPEETVLNAWIKRAGLLGSNLAKVVKTDQEGYSCDWDNFTSDIPFDTIPDYVASCQADDLDTIRIGIPRHAICDLEPDEALAFKKATEELKALGAEVVDNVELLVIDEWNRCASREKMATSVHEMADSFNDCLGTLQTNLKTLYSLQDVEYKKKGTLEEGYSD